MTNKSGKKKVFSVPLTLAGGFAVTIGGVAALGNVIDSALRPATKSLDHRMVHTSREIELPLLKPSMKVLSSLGEPWALYPIAGFTGIRWLLQGRTGDSSMLAAAILGSAALDKTLKEIVQRRRPLFRIPWRKSSGSSFPSNHMTMSVATYCTMAMLSGRSTRSDKSKQEDRQERRGRQATARLMVIAIALCGLIGYSRIYLGVHHPSDIVGGWIAGTAWMVACGLAANQLAGSKGSKE